MSVLVRPHFGNQKHRTSLCKSTEVLPQKYGAFMQRSPMFLFFRSLLPSPPKKKFFENLLHFLHPARKTPMKPGIFWCRIGCRITPWCKIILHLPPFSIPFSPYFYHGNVSEVCSFVQHAAGKMSRKRQKRQQNPTPILHPAPYPTPNPTPGTASKY